MDSAKSSEKHSDQESVSGGDFEVIVEVNTPYRFGLTYQGLTPSHNELEDSIAQFPDQFGGECNPAIPRLPL